MSDEHQDLGLDALLRDTASVKDAAVASADLTAGYTDLQREVVSVGRNPSLQGRVARWQRSRKRVLLGGAAAVVLFSLAPTGAVATGWFSARTGLFGSSNATENGNGEFLDTGARDFPEIASKLAAGISYPPGDSADTYIASLHLANAGLMEDAGVRDFLRGEAVCAWSGYWLDARKARDSKRQTIAVRGLADPPAALAWVSTAARAGDQAKLDSYWIANCADLPRLWKNR